MRRNQLSVFTVAECLLIVGSTLAAPPTWSSVTVSRRICENIKENELAYTIKATAADPGDTLEYSLDNEDSIDFKMCSTPSTDGRVCANKDLDRETLSNYLVTEVAANGDEMIKRTVNVIIEDVNDNEPVFENLPYSFTMPEGTSMGSKIGTISAYDNDNAQAGAVTLTLDDEKGMLVLQSGGSSAPVTISRDLDFEESPNFFGTVFARDRGDENVACGPQISLSSNTSVYLNVADGPDTKPIFALPQYSADLQENALKLNSELTIEARDGDFGLNWPIEYSIEDNFTVFEIDKDSGNLTVLPSADVDREAITSGYYTLVVKAQEIEPTGFDWKPFPDRISFPGADSATVEVTIFVQDANDNQPLFYSDAEYEKVTTTYEVSVKESNVGPVPSFVIYIKDADQSENAIFDLTLTGDDAKYFELSQTSNLRSQASLSLLVDNLDFETKPKLTFQIEASEPGKAGSTTATVTITVTDENDNSPVFTSSNSHVFIDENPAADFTVTYIVATDADSGEYGEIVFTLQPDNSGFNISETTGEVFVTNSELDREIRAEYYLTVLATDKGGRVSTTQLTITLNDVNDMTPAFQQTQYIVNWNENDPDPEPIQVLAFDGDDSESDNSKMEIFFDDTTISDRFIINATVANGAIEGNILPKDELDAEVLDAPCSNGVIQFQFPIFVHDKGTPQLNSSSIVTVFFRDVNDHTPQFNSSVYYGSVPEESDPDTNIATVFANDDDKCLTNNDITFLVDNDFADKFLMGPSENGASTLKVRASLDRNDQDSYDVIVYAVDSGQPRRTGNATIKVTITDINNKNPLFNETNSDNAVVIETAVIGKEVASLFASDLDLNSMLEFTIPSWRCINENGENVDDSDCSNWFNITSMNEEGIIKVAGELDRETVATVVLTVQVEDLNAVDEGEQISQMTFTIVIEDFNDNDPVIEKPTVAFDVFEELTKGVSIGRLSATDKDENNIIKFTVDSPFVDISEDGEITVGGRIDREGVPGETFTAVITATDNDTTSGVSRSSSITVDFNVIDTNDHNPTFKSSNYTCSIEENQPEETHLCFIVATDDDVGSNAEIAYSLPGVTQFVINSTTGEISSNEMFDREFLDIYQFKLRARDSAGDLSRETEVDVTINIVDLDDNEPTYAENVLNYQTMVFVEENDPGSSIGEVQKAYDADTTANQENCYFLVYESGNDLSDKFALDKVTRELFALKTLDREANSSYTLNVLTTRDDSISSTNITKYDDSKIVTVDIAVEDINDNAPAFPRKTDTTDLLYSTTYGENNIVSILTANDPDAGLNSVLKYEILSETYQPPGGAESPTSPQGGFFEIDSTNGQVKTTAKSFEGAVEVGGLFRLEIRVTDRNGDADGLSDKMTLDIKIFDETETVIMLSRYSEQYLEENRDQIESDLEDALNADVVIDKIVPQATSAVTPAARATNDDGTLTEIHFHATEFNETTLIPSDEIAAELDSTANNDVLIKWAVVSISTSDANTGNPITETDLLKAVLAVVSAVLILFLVVLAIAFICMRRSYKRKIKVLRATEEGNRSIDQLASNDKLNIPNTNINAGMESELYLENQKEAINLSYLNESTDDNNSIDDNAVDSHDSAFSGDRQGSLKEDDFGDVDIDYPNDDDDLANLQNVLNRKGSSNMVFDSTFDDITAI